MLPAILIDAKKYSHLTFTFFTSFFGQIQSLLINLWPWILTGTWVLTWTHHSFPEVIAWLIIMEYFHRVSMTIIHYVSHMYTYCMCIL